MTKEEDDIDKKVKATTTFIYNFAVTEDLLDDYNHVNNARYLDLYEEARWLILDEKSLGRDFIRTQGIGPVILEVRLKFKRELKKGENITIETTTKNEGDRIFYFYQNMLNEAGKLCSSAVFKAALFDLKSRRMLRADDKWIKAFGL